MNGVGKEISSQEKTLLTYKEAVGLNRRKFSMVMKIEMASIFMQKFLSSIAQLKIEFTT
jgi:hypothetical protein